jgi:hypothetical protein
LLADMRPVGREKGGQVEREEAGGSVGLRSGSLGEYMQLWHLNEGECINMRPMHAIKPV